jgi:hypothetical protein
MNNRIRRQIRKIKAMARQQYPEIPESKWTTLVTLWEDKDFQIEYQHGTIDNNIIRYWYKKSINKSSI